MDMTPWIFALLVAGTFAQELNPVFSTAPSTAPATAPGTTPAQLEGDSTTPDPMQRFA